MRKLTERWLADLSGLAPRVVLADGNDPRTVEAARRLARTTPVEPVLLRDALPVSDEVDVLSPTVARRVPRLVGCLDATLARRAIPVDEREALTSDPLYLGAAAVRVGLADACVGGAARPTTDVIRAGIRVLGLAEGASTVTSCFLMVLAGTRPNPTPELAVCTLSPRAVRLLLKPRLKDASAPLRPGIPSSRRQPDVTQRVKTQARGLLRKGGRSRGAA